MAIAFDVPSSWDVIPEIYAWLTPTVPSDLNGTQVFLHVAS